jgi:hypothetical protein
MMDKLIGVYNQARQSYEQFHGGRTGVAADFKGGSGKMFRVGAYVRHPREIIKIMDGGGDRPADVPEESMAYVGRSKKEMSGAATDRPEVEALAVYPENRIRGWDVRSDDRADPYADFRNLHQPFGSSGKENAYAIAAGLREKLPTTFSAEGAEMRRQIREYVSGGRRNAELGLSLRQRLGDAAMDNLEEMAPEDIGRIDRKDEAAGERFRTLTDAFKENFGRPESITDALRFYASRSPGETTFNPERSFIGSLMREMLKGNPTEKEELAKRMRETFGLDEAVLAKLKEAKDEEEVRALVQSEDGLRSTLAAMPEKVTLAAAADKYERLLGSSPKRV